MDGPAFNRAVEEIDRIVHELLDALVTNAPPRERDAEAIKAKGRGRRVLSPDETKGF